MCTAPAAKTSVLAARVVDAVLYTARTTKGLALNSTRTRTREEKAFASVLEALESHAILEAHSRRRCCSWRSRLRSRPPSWRDSCRSYAFTSLEHWGSNKKQKGRRRGGSPAVVDGAAGGEDGGLGGHCAVAVVHASGGGVSAIHFDNAARRARDERLHAHAAQVGNWLNTRIAFLLYSVLLTNACAATDATRKIIASETRRKKWERART